MSPAATISAVLPEYDVSRELGRGAMGVVYLARHRKLGRDVAVKELSGPLADDPDVRSRFLSEARTLATLDHPHIVPIYDYVESGGRCLLIMEALPGGTVWSAFTSKGLTLARSCALALATCSGVQHAHEHGVLHRDLKPENLLFTAAGDLKVGDFGIAKVLDGGRTLATMDGSVLGTPAYMAPEQAEGATVGPAADIYAIGTMLYEMVSGRLPFDGDSPMSLLVQRISKDAPPVTNVAPTVPQPIADVIMRCLERDAANRFSSAEALGCALGSAAADALGTDWLMASGVTVSGSRAILVSASTAASTPTIPPRSGGAAVARPEVDAPPTVLPLGSPADRDNIDAPATVLPLRARDDRADVGTVASRSSDAAPESTPPPEVSSAPTGVTRARSADDSHQRERHLHDSLAEPAASDESAALNRLAAAAASISTVIRPRATSHVPGFDSSLRRSDLLDIDAITSGVAPTRTPAVVCAASSLLALLLVFLVPVARPALRSDPALRGLTVNGIAPPARGILPVNLARPLVLRGIGGGQVAQVQFRLAGIPVGSHRARIRGGAVRIPLGRSAVLLHGPLTMHVTVTGAGGRSVSRDVAVESTHKPLRSAQAPVLVIIALAALSSAEANSRRHRKGRVINSAVATAAITGAVGMFAVSLLWSMWRPGLPSTLRALALLVVSALAFGSLTVLRARLARQRRLRWKADR